jgi:hypothetical protein
MKIVSRQDQTIVVQREEFIVNLNPVQIALTVLIIVCGILVLLPQSIPWIWPELVGDTRWHEAENLLSASVAIGIAAIGIIVFLGLALDKLWQAIKSPAQIRLWETYTFDTAKDAVETNKWPELSSLGPLSALKTIEVIVDIDYRADLSDPESTDMSPTSFYQVVAIFDADRQEILERNDVRLASSESLQQRFRQQLAETHRAVADLREFLGVPVLIDEKC